MAQIGNFDANTVAPSVAPEAIPSGWYPVFIKESEMKENSAKTGEFLAITMEIFGCPYAKSNLFDRLNLKNQNPVAVDIAYQQLSAICHATGRIQIQDSAQLHNLPMEVKVALRPAGPGKDGKFYEASNEVKGYRAWTANTAPVAPVAPIAPIAPAPVAAWTPPVAPAPVAAAPVAAAPAWTPPVEVAAPIAAVQPAAWTPPVAAAPVAAAPVAAPAAWTPPVEAAPVAAPAWAPPAEVAAPVAAPVAVAPVAAPVAVAPVAAAPAAAPVAAAAPSELPPWQR